MRSTKNNNIFVATHLIAKLFYGIGKSYSITMKLVLKLGVHRNYCQFVKNGETSVIKK